jgi:alcohol dehydrogenase class IV
MKNFDFFQDTKIIFGAGRMKEVGTIAKEYGDSCLLVTTSSHEILAPIYENARNILQEAGMKVAHFDGVVPNPTTESIKLGAEMARSVDADVIIGLGGGSSMDSAKAIAVEATHEGSCWEYLFYKEQPTEKTLPVIAVSTTSGTGSQVTQVAVVTNAAERDKSALYNNLLYPRVAIIDPEIMTTMPEFVTATTGFDVFCHAFESLIHPNCGAYVGLLAREAIDIVASTLPKIMQDPTNVELRSAVAWADTMAGLCIANAGVTLPHGMGMAIGGMYPHVAHGQALAIVYPACTKVTWQHAVKEYAFMARAFNNDLKQLNDKEAAGRSYSEIVKFLKQIKLYQKLEDVDMPESEVEALAKRSMVLPDYGNNPKVVTYDEMVELVKASY